MTDAPYNDHDLLVRIDERTRTLHESVDSLNKKMGNYVTRKEFMPVKSIVYGVVSVIGVGLVGALISLILK